MTKKPQIKTDFRYKFSDGDGVIMNVDKRGGYVVKSQNHNMPHEIFIINKIKRMIDPTFETEVSEE